MPTYSIYALDDPRDGKSRYVGRTRLNIHERASAHWGARRKHPCLKGWLLDLESNQLKPVARLLQRHDHPDAESYWASQLIKEGHPILNINKIHLSVYEHDQRYAVQWGDPYYWWYAKEEWPDRVVRREYRRQTAHQHAIRLKASNLRQHKIDMILPRNAACYI